MPIMFILKTCKNIFTLYLVEGKIERKKMKEKKIERFWTFPLVGCREKIRREKKKENGCGDSNKFSPLLERKLERKSDLFKITTLSYFFSLFIYNKD